MAQRLDLALHELDDSLNVVRCPNTHDDARGREGAGKAPAYKSPAPDARRVGFTTPMDRLQTRTP